MYLLKASHYSVNMKAFKSVFSMKALYLLLLVICVAITTAQPNYDGIDLQDSDLTIEPRIVGGKDAIEGQFPYQVSLRTRFLRQHFCGGSIISSYFILTAAHCTQGILSKPYFIVAVIGSIYRKKGGVTIKLNKIMSHEEWDRSKLINDIALLRTAEEVLFSSTIQPVALTTKNLPDDGKTSLLLSGWGKNSISVRFHSTNFWHELVISTKIRIILFRFHF